jgi:hypothetical protein
MKNMKIIDLELPHVLLNLRKTRRSYGGDTSIAITGYGSYLCDWNGGRNVVPSRGESYDGEGLRYHNGRTVQEDRSFGNGEWRPKAQKLIIERVGSLNRKGIPFLATMTNTCPSSRDNDSEAFKFLDLVADGMEGNGVVVESPQIAGKIQRRYGKRLQRVSSVIRWYDRPISYRGLLGQFDKVVIKPEDVLTPDGKLDVAFFQGLGEEGRNKSVVMLNYPCQRECGSAREHYRLVSEQAKSYPVKSRIDPKWWRCSHTQELMLDGEHVEQLAEMGVTNFKIGRNKYATSKSLEIFPQVSVFKDE